MKIPSYENMFYTNMCMALTSLVVSVGFGEFFVGVQFCIDNPIMLR